MLSMKYPTRMHSYGTWHWMFLAHRYKPVCAEQCWEKKLVIVTNVPPVNFLLRRKLLWVFCSVSYISGTNCCDFKAIYNTLLSLVRLNEAIKDAYFVPLVAAPASSKTDPLSLRNNACLWDRRWKIYSFTDPCRVLWGAFGSRAGSAAGTAAFSRIT